MRPRAGRDRGYALLAVLFFGAVMAILLAVSLPRAAFEAQRAKEELLIYRGNQYARAVQLYFRKYKRYPARLEDLENTNNIRFLRKKYVDPITKTEEWRFIHIGPAGMFTDSLVYDKVKPKKEGESTWSGPPPVTPGPETAPPITGMADRLRAGGGPTGFPTDSPQGAPAPGGFPAPYPAPGQVTYFNPANPAQAASPGATAVYPGAGFPPGTPYPGAPGATPFGTAPGGVPGAPMVGGAFPGGTPFPGAGFPPAPGTGFTLGQGGAPRQPAAPVYPGQPLPVPVPGVPGVGSEAARIIGQLLTTPRPGGLAGIQAGGQPGAFGVAGGGSGQTFGGGIAGVASKSEARGVKVVNERETYNEWEFVYDYRKDPLLMGAVAGAGAVPGQPGFGQPGFGQPGPPVTPINPMQPGLPGSPLGPPGSRRGPPTIVTPGAPTQR